MFPKNIYTQTNLTYRICVNCKRMKNKNITSQKSFHIATTADFVFFVQIFAKLARILLHGMAHAGSKVE